MPPPNPHAIAPADAEVLKPLADKVAALAALPVQDERRRLWKRLNRLQAVRPLLHICQVPWHEFNDEAMRLRCRGDLARQVESQLRRTLWPWEHFPADDVVEPAVTIGAAKTESDWGLPLVKREHAAAVAYPPLIRCPDDVRKIRTPEIRADHQTTAARAAALEAVFGGTLRVEPQTMVVPAMWDLLIQWYGTKELMIDLVDRPDLVHAAARRTTDMLLARMKQLEAEGLLFLNNRNHGAGNGGLAYTDELPQADFDGRVRLCDLWGNQMAQIFSGVSPAMHDAFALAYEIDILRHFGLNNYGCCEPLDWKVAIVRKIPRLRRISMSPWVDWRRGAQAVGTDFVYSAKPNPAYLAGETWDPRPAETQIRHILDATRGLRVEIVLKDIHTLRGQPERLAAWHRMAVRLIEQYG